MGKNTIKVDVSWTEDNFCGGWSDDDCGTVVVTAKTLEGLKEDFKETLRLHIEGCVADGDVVPGYLIDGDYEVEYELDTSALLRDAEKYTTLAALSHASGINQKQLSHYASGLKHPRQAQIEKIKAGLHRIGTRLLALT